MNSCIYRKFQGLGLLVMACLLMATLAQAAPNLRISSLQQDLKTTSDASRRTDLLNALSAAFLPSNLDSALAYAAQAYDLSRTANYTLGLGEARLNQAYALIEKGLLADARALLKKAEVEFAQSKNVEGMGKVALCEVAFARAADDVLPALAGCLKADSLFRLAAYPAGQVRTRLVEAAIFQELGSDSLALTFLEEAAELLKLDSNDRKGFNLLPVLREMAAVKERMGNYAAALDDAESAGAIYDAAKHYDAQAIAVEISKARLHGLLGNRPLQRKTAEIALQIAQNEQDSLSEAFAWTALGRAHLDAAHPDLAGPCFANAVTLLQGRSAPDALAAAYLGLAQSRRRRLDYDRAIAATDSVLALAGPSNTPVRAAAFLLRKQVYAQTGNSRQSLIATDAHAALLGRAAFAVQRRRDRELAIRLAYAELLHARSEQADVQSVTDRYVDMVNQHDLFALIALAALGGVLLLCLLLLFRARARRKLLLGKLKKRDEDLDAVDHELQIVQQRFADLREETFRQPAPVAPAPAPPEVDIDALVTQRTAELRLQVTRLSALNEELDTFMYRASHDLLGPIARLKGLILVARNAEDDVDVLNKYIDLIEAVSVYMDRVLRKLILVHDLQHSLGTEDSTDIAALIEDITPRLAELPGISRPVILLHDEVESPVGINPYLLRIVLENLLENACIFRSDMASASPRINVRLRRVEGKVEISLRDEGIGVPDAIRAQVFDIFFRGSERSKGNGLGLYLVKLAVERLGGEIALESEEGVFTRVVVLVGEG